MRQRGGRRASARRRGCARWGSSLARKAVEGALRLSMGRRCLGAGRTALHGRGGQLCFHCYGLARCRRSWHWRHTCGRRERWARPTPRQRRSPRHSGSSWRRAASLWGHPRPAQQTPSRWAPLLPHPQHSGRPQHRAARLRAALPAAHGPRLRGAHKCRQCRNTSSSCSRSRGWSRKGMIARATACCWLIWRAASTPGAPSSGGQRSARPAAALLAGGGRAAPSMPPAFGIE